LLGWRETGPKIDQPLRLQFRIIESGYIIFKQIFIIFCRGHWCVLASVLLPSVFYAYTCSIFAMYCTTSFIADLERAMDKVKDGEEGISIHGIRINNLRFADDIDIIARWKGQFIHYIKKQ